jgi:hypothetical protein
VSSPPTTLAGVCVPFCLGRLVAGVMDEEEDEIVYDLVACGPS